MNLKAINPALRVIFLSGLCDREQLATARVLTERFLSGLCDRELGPLGTYRT